MSSENKVTVIEINADLLYLVVLGTKKSLEKMIHNIKNNNPNDFTQYIPVKINTPTSKICYDLSLDENISKNIKLDESVETAQCYTYADGYDSNIYMLMRLFDNGDILTLGYINFELIDEEDPEELVEIWFRHKLHIIPNGIKKNLKYISVIGEKTNILVLATKLIQ
jgi:hypothetical protein